MKSVHYFICLAISGLCLLMTVLLFLVGQSASGLQTTLAQQQEEINKGSMSQQVGANLLRDMIQLAVTNNNPRLFELLRRSGISVQAQPAAPPPAAPQAGQPAAGTPAATTPAPALDAAPKAAPKNEKK